MNLAKAFATPLFALIAGLALAACLATQPANAADASHAPAHAKAILGGKIIPRFNHAISNIPGKSLIAVEVDYPPGGSTPAHHHAASAFIMGYVISGAIRSKVGDQPAHVYHAGDTFYETPGADHMISANASDTQPAKLLAVFVVNTDHGALTTLDHK